MTPAPETTHARDGLVRIPELLLEAICCAPLSGGELRVVLFIARKVFSWAGKTQAERNFLFDRCTHEDIARATGVPLGTVRNAMGRLQKAGVLTGIPLTRGGPKAYGINLNVDQWGVGNHAWAMYKPTLYDAQDSGLFRLDAGVTAPPEAGGADDGPLPKNGQTPITNSGRPPDQKWSGVGPASPRGARDEPISVFAETGKTETVQKSVEETVEDMLGDGEDPDDFELQSPPEVAKPTNPEKLNNEEIEARTDALFERMDPTLKEAIDGYLLFMASKRVYKHLAPMLRWKTVMAFCKLSKEPGITPDNILFGVEAALSADAENTNYVASAARSDAIKALEQGAGSRRKTPSLRFIQLANGGRTMEREWTMGQRMLVEEEIAKGNWDVQSGCSLEPCPGFCCVDGKFYGGSGEEPTKWK